MKAKLNFTNRETINLNQISLIINEIKGDDPLVEMDIDISNLDLNIDDRVYLEGAFSGFYQKFDYGTVGKLAAPADNRIKEIPKDFIDAASFYVKIVDESTDQGKLRALSKKIIPTVKTSGDEKSKADRSFFLVKQADLGETPWKIITEGSSILILNSKFSNPKNLLKNNPFFRNILIPAAVKEILLRIVAEADEFSCEGDEWFVPWNIYVSQSLQVSLPKEEDDLYTKLEFVDNVMDVFCSRLTAAEKILKSL